MNSTFKLTTPVLFLTFNRLDTTKQVFEEIRKAKPSKLFLASDGPREDKEGEKEKVEEVRKYLLKNIDWKCDVKKLFRKKNLGCKYAVSGAIDWFFENVEEGIILEDDCLPSQSFFRFCQEMLGRYKDEKKVMHISGTNVESVSKIKEDYFFSNTFNVWGWATWKRAWRHYDVEMKLWPRYNSMVGMKRLDIPGLINKIRLKKIFNSTYLGRINTWDYQWDFACKKKGGSCIIPKKNLITNLGTQTGTHTTSEDTKRFILPRHRVELNKDLKKGRNPRYKINFYKFFRKPLKTYLLQKLK